MIRIETGLISQKKDTSNIIMEYEQEDAQVGEYLAILDKIKNEVLENTNLGENELKEILFKDR